jgi:hypothetical protein
MIAISLPREQVVGMIENTGCESGTGISCNVCLQMSCNWCNTFVEVLY